MKQETYVWNKSKVLAKCKLGAMMCWWGDGAGYCWKRERCSKKEV